jgi:hypothetical protein
LDSDDLMHISDRPRSDSPLVLGRATCKWDGAESRVLHVTRLALNYAYLLSLSPPPLGATVSIRLELARTDPLPPIEGRVVSTSLDPTRAHNCGFGVVFTSLSSKALAALCTTLDRVGLPSAPPPGPRGERRTEPRIGVDGGVDARLQTPQGPRSARVVNLSLGGALLELHTAEGSWLPRRNAAIHMDITLDRAAEVIPLQAMVVRRTGDSKHPGIAVRFVDVSPATRARVEFVLLHVLGRNLERDRD